MNKKLLLIITLITLSSVVMMPAPVLADSVCYSGTLDIEPNTYYFFGGADAINDGIYGTFEITSGGTITFFILDQYDFDQFHNHQIEEVNKMHLLQNMADGNINFRIPASGIYYYYVFDNRANNVTQALTYAISKDMTGPEITTNLVNKSVQSQTMSINANAEDANFGVTSMSLYINTILLYTVQGSILTYDWDTTTYPDAFHTVVIRAVDNVRNGFGELGNIAELIFIIVIDNIDPTTSTTNITTTTGTTNTTLPTTDADGNPIPPGSNYTFYQYESLLVTNLLLTAILGILIAPIINKHWINKVQSIQEPLNRILRIRKSKEPEGVPEPEAKKEPQDNHNKDKNKGNEQP